MMQINQIARELGEATADEDGFDDIRCRWGKGWEMQFNGCLKHIGKGVPVPWLNGFPSPSGTKTSPLAKKPIPVLETHSLLPGEP
jgi:hypothetical protein